MRLLLTLMFGVIATVAGAASFPSPDDWRDENIYFIFTDRFNDGDPANNAAEAPGAPYAPSNSRGIHGGDFKGIEKKVDYLKALGATAIWITPMVRNVGGSAYHGYGAQDFYQLAPHLSTLTDLSNMVAACHSRGIKVILDIVVNHSGNLINSSDSGYPNFKTPPAGDTMKYANNANQHAPPFNITNAVPAAFTSIFHTNGVIQDFSNIDQVEKGELSNLDDFNTQLTYVRTNMANIYKYWIQTGDLDGFRIDTVKHVDHGNGGFWNYWCPEIHNFATSIGKSNFFMFGEVYDGSDTKCGGYTGTKLSTNFALDSVVDYPLYFMIGGIFASGTGNTKQIEDHYNNIPANYDPAAQYRLVTFLDNHDQRRFLSINSSTNRLAVALTFLYTSRGIPCLYYGTEQAFNGGTDPNNREDMFAGQFPTSGPSFGDCFNMTQPLFRHVALLNNLRRNYPALRRGGHRNLWNSSGGPGLFAYARTNGNQEVMVVFNTASSAQTLGTRPTIYPAGTQLVNLFDTNEVITVTGTPEIPSISVPSFQAKVFVAKSQFQPLDPVVTSVTPAHGTTNISATAAVVVQFSKPMDTNSVQAAFSVQSRPGTFAWSSLHDTMTFTPSSSLTGTTNIVRVATNAMDAVDGKTFFAPFESYFVTAGSAGADTTPPTLAITNPGNGALLTGTVNVTGTASDVGGTVAKVEVQLDNGNWTQTSGTTSWSYSLDTTKFLNGSHVISARATDSSGNVSTVQFVTVKFSNVPNSYLVRLSAGNPSSVTDCDNNVWLADQAYTLGSFGYAGGSTGFVNDAIAGICAQAQPLYQRERYSDNTSSFRYLFDCPEGVYETTLLETETWTNAPNGRVFNVFVEGQQVLTNFDIFAATGGKDIPIALVFTSAVADAQLEIEFSAILDNARASGIQVRKIADLDSDGDGIPDWWMLAYFDHPTGQAGDFSEADDDPDGDGLTNLQEYLGGTNPLVANSSNATASFTGTPTSGVAPLLVSFTDASTGPITNRFWDFGDGATTNITGTSVQHTYSATGAKTVVLTVTGILGNQHTQTRTGYITVSPPSVPSAPSNLSATSVFESQIALAWQDNATNEQAFIIQRGPSVAGPWATVATVNSNVTGATDCGLAGGATYFYQVLATNVFGASPPSNLASATTPSTNNVIAYDRASESAYSGSWPSGSNGGTGFGAWRLLQTPTSGFFAGSSANNGPGGGITINSCGKAFGLFANSTGNAVAYRALNTPLAVGQSLLWRMDNGYVDTSSSVGIVLRTGNSTNTVDNYSTNARFEFLFQGGSNTYNVVDSAGRRDTGVGYSTQALELTFTLTGVNTYSLHITRMSNNTSTNITGTLKGTSGAAVDSLALYNRNAGTGASFDVFFNYFRRTDVNFDSVGDGIPDGWRALYFGGDGTATNVPGSCALCNPDGDGLNNLQEFLSGTIPNDPSSAFRITDIGVDGNDIFVIWTTQPNKTNQLESSSAVGTNANWNSVGAFTIGTGSPATQTDFGAATNPPTFYRVRLLP